MIKLHRPEQIDARTKKRIVYAYHTRDWDWAAMARAAEFGSLVAAARMPETGFDGDDPDDIEDDGPETNEYGDGLEVGGDGEGEV